MRELRFTARLTRDGRAHVLALGGELDLAVTGELEAALPAVAAGELLVLDLRELLFIDSAGIHVLMRLDAAARDGGWDLALVRARPEVQRILDLTHVGERIRTVDAPDAA